jgi:hypothetical protein
VPEPFFTTSSPAWYHRAFADLGGLLPTLSQTTRYDSPEGLSVVRKKPQQGQPSKDNRLPKRTILLLELTARELPYGNVKTIEPVSISEG